MVRKKMMPLILVVVMAVSLLGMIQPAQAVTTNLRVGFKDGFGIYQSTDENGDAQGIHIDLMNALADELSFSVEYIPFSYDAQCYQALETGEIDLVLGTPPGVTAQYAFSEVDALSDYSLCLLADDETAEKPKNNQSLSGYQVAVDKEHVQAISNHPRGQGGTLLSNNNFTLKDNQKDVLDSLLNGKVRLAICEKENAIQYLDECGVSNQYTIVVNHLVQTSSVILTRMEDRGLFNRINFALSKMRTEGTYDEILDRWIYSERPTISPEAWRTIILIASAVASLIVLYIFISTRMRKQLSLQVKEQTRELREINDVLAEKMEQLQGEKDLRGSIVQNASSAMVVYDQENKVSLLNQQALRMIGGGHRVTADSLVEELPVFGALLKQSGGPGTVNTNPEQFPFVVNGETRFFRCTHYLLPAEGNDKKHLFSVEDVTAEETEKQALFEKEKNRVLNNIITGLAHEIKNPLTAINAFSEMIPDQMEDREFLEAFYRLVPAETERINSLIESLVDYARPSRGEITTIDLAELTEICIDLTAPLAQKAGVKVELRAERDCLILGNRDHIQQALINYLMNAIDAIRERPDKNVPESHPMLCVFIRGQGRRVCLEIYDEGIGMDAETLQQCMDPFFTTKAKGTGLGMAVALQGIHENKGKVRVESVKDSFTRIMIEFERCEE